MISDAERREVAARLRELAGGYVTIGELESALGICLSSPEVDLERDARDLHRMADLIEPEPKRTCSLEYDTVHHDYVCTKCGERYDSGMYTSVSDDDKFLLKPMRFCTNCGAKVVRND